MLSEDVTAKLAKIDALNRRTLQRLQAKAPAPAALPPLPVVKSPILQSSPSPNHCSPSAPSTPVLEVNRWSLEEAPLYSPVLETNKSYLTSSGGAPSLQSNTSPSRPSFGYAEGNASLKWPTLSDPSSQLTSPPASSRF